MSGGGDDRILPLAHRDDAAGAGVLLDEAKAMIQRGSVRNDLKRELDELYGSLRPRICLACGKPFGVFDMHEGIVTRGDVRGWKPAAKKEIMTRWNCIPLHHDCNLNHPPSRQAVWNYQVEYYGNAVRDWYYGLPWKAGVPRRFE